MEVVEVTPEMSQPVGERRSRSRRQEEEASREALRGENIAAPN